MLVRDAETRSRLFSKLLELLKLFREEDPHSDQNHGG